MVGQGMLGMDIAVFMLTVAAAFVSGYMALRWRGEVSGFSLLRVLRMVGWSIFAARFGVVLFSSGDVLISVPSAIAICFLACGDIAIVFFRGRKVSL